VDRSTEKKILDDLDAENPDLAEQIRLNLFIFEDIISLDRAAIQRVIREVSNDDLTLALKGASAKVASMIYSNISKRAAETLKDDIEFLGPVRLSAVEEAQKKIVGIIRRLDEAGEIIMGRSEDDALIL
jgi:flagellar motor switch protein FliG